MGRVILYIAASLDGFIARPDDDIGWLDEFMGGGEDYGYAALLRSTGTAILGARTYEQALLHPERLLPPEIKTYVLTRRPLPSPPLGDVELFDGGPAELLERIEQEDDRDIWLVGGGQVISSFLNDGLIDELRLFVAPLLLGEGLPLHPAPLADVRFQFVQAIPYASGLVQLRYQFRADDANAD